MYSTLKNIHLLLAAASFLGFLLRATWMLRSDARLHARPTRVLPHVVDTLLLASGVALLFVLSLNPLETPWLLAKFAGLVVYIVAGALALRHGRTSTVRVTALGVAVVAFGYIVGAAWLRSAGSWFAMMGGP